MSELTERLRKMWPIVEAGPKTTAQRKLAHEAADEIERLEGELAKTTNAFAGVLDRDAVEIERLEGKLSRLRAIYNTDRVAAGHAREIEQKCECSEADQVLYKATIQWDTHKEFCPVMCMTCGRPAMLQAHKEEGE